MKTFKCACGARIFFENTVCLACKRELGFLVKAGSMSTLEPGEEGQLTALLDGAAYKKCKNTLEQAACNWLIPASEVAEFCQACRLNRIVPDLSDPWSRKQWADTEAAKRRLLYTINQLGLPVVPQTEAPDGDGLAFDIKADTPNQPVMTGHSDGLITLNLAEADPSLREKARQEMDERYRTLLGHFRHEIGHYYWDVLVRESQWLEPFRQLFGNERVDYAAALAAHYAEPRADWAVEFISAYASSHPWEDWAETWAHYLHITDTLETAAHFGFDAPGESPTGTFADRLVRWRELTVALNALNRSMGMPDPYPFQLTPRVEEKLAFVDQVVRAHCE